MNAYYQNKVVIVTGGASGIGLALCELLLPLGARAVVMADINPETLGRESARLEAAYPGKVLRVKTDVTKQEEVAALIRRAAEFGSGRMDILFNNAGLGLMKPFEEITDEDWARAFAINFHGAVHGIRAALPIMRAQGGGHIANTASGAAFSPMPYQAMYSATKAALVALTSALRAEFWDDNIRFTTVIPGTVATAIWRGQPPACAITPEASARAILAGVAANERIVFVTDADREGAANSTRPEVFAALDEYFVRVARRRRGGELDAV